MSKFTNEMIDEYAEKLLIGLTAEENKMVLDEMDVIEESFEEISKIDGINDIEPMTHCLENLEVELREDIAEESIEIEDALANSDRTEDREIIVPKVVG